MIIETILEIFFFGMGIMWLVVGQYEFAIMALILANICQIEKELEQTKRTNKAMQIALKQLLNEREVENDGD